MIRMRRQYISPESKVYWEKTNSLQKFVTCAQSWQNSSGRRNSFHKAPGAGVCLPCVKTLKNSMKLDQRTEEVDIKSGENIS